MVALGSCSLAGSRYGELNQDYVEVHEVFTAQEIAQRKTTQAYIAAVLDGHGLLGEKAARKAGNAICKFLIQQLKKESIFKLTDEAMQQMMEEAFLTAHLAALEVYQDPPKTYVYPKGSQCAEKYALMYIDKMPIYHCRKLGGDRLLEFGATCTVAIVHGKNVVTANVGDSGAVLGRVIDGETGAQSLTVRHWGHNESEVKRVMGVAGNMVTFLGEDGYLSIEQGRWRGYQLSMTRALGHKMLANYGVIFNPSMRRVTLTADDFCLVLASDGVWDVFDDLEVVNRVAECCAEGLNAHRIATRVAREAVKMAMSSPGCDADNTTVAVMLL